MIETQAVQRALRRIQAREDRALRRKIDARRVSRHYREPGPMRRFARWLVDTLRDMGGNY